MIVVGAGGFAKELLEVIIGLQEDKHLVFYDDVSTLKDKRLYTTYPILTNLTQAQEYFKNTDNRFVLGLGNPTIRKTLVKKFIELGGELTTIISAKAIIGKHDVEIGSGCTILDNAIISNGSRLGEGCLVYFNTVITHDCKIGNYVEFAPGATLLGDVKVADFAFIGANATILPHCSIGKNSIIGAGSVVTKDIPNGSKVKGIPAK
jgi:sugar O-acyltransferase (sialic acid O-acetyltransferase NeuD family)